MGLLIGMAAVLPARGDDEAPRLVALLRDTAPAIVTIKVVANTMMQAAGNSADHESRFEMPGVVVDASGLVMTSILPFAPELLLKLVAPGSAAQVKTVPTEIEVLFEQD